MLIKYTKLVIKINKSNDAPLYKEFRKQNKIMILLTLTATYVK